MGRSNRAAKGRMDEHEHLEYSRVHRALSFARLGGSVVRAIEVTQSEVSMDALAERCFQLDAYRQERRIEEQKHSYFRALSYEGTGFFLRSLIARFLIGVQRRKIRASMKQSIAAYERGEPWAVARVHEYAVEEFRNRVAAHREKTLGDNSEWGRARASLMEAESDAQRSAAYWRARWRQEPSNEFAKSQKDVSDRLQASSPRRSRSWKPAQSPCAGSTTNVTPGLLLWNAATVTLRNFVAWRSCRAGRT